MEISAKQRLDNFMNGLDRRNPGQSEFHQAVYEVAVDIIPFMQENPIYEDMKILERLTEPDQVVIFRVNWEDDHRNFRANRGYRVQHNNAIGPYKGGIRFHRDLTLDTLKFLALEQTFKNSMHMSWSGEDIEKRLYEIMKDIHNKCVQYGTEGDYINYRKGANIAGFVKVADAMVACGNI